MEWNGMEWNGGWWELIYNGRNGMDKEWNGMKKE